MIGTLGGGGRAFSHRKCSGYVRPQVMIGAAARWDRG